MTHKKYQPSHAIITHKILTFPYNYYPPKNINFPIQLLPTEGVNLPIQLLPTKGVKYPERRGGEYWKERGMRSWRGCELEGRRSASGTTSL